VDFYVLMVIEQRDCCWGAW